MTFEQALVNLRAGSKVYRPGRHIYSGIKPVWLAYKQANGKLVWDHPGAMFPTPWLMPEDLEANDWEEYKD